MADLHNLLPPGSKAVILAHLMQWFRPGNAHSARAGVTYDSADLVVIARQVRLARSLGVDGFVVDWYGPPEVNADEVCFRNLLAMSQVLGGFRAGICIDKGAVRNLMATGLGPQQAFQAAYDYVRSNYAASPAFFGDFVMQYGCGKLGVNLGAVANATIPLLHDDPAVGRYFTWCLPDAARVAAHYSDPNCAMGSVCAHFNDGDPENRNVQIWDNKLAVRLLDPAHTGENWRECWKNLPPAMSHVQLVTWNDYEEGTAIEGELAMLQGGL